MSLMMIDLTHSILSLISEAEHTVAYIVEEWIRAGTCDSYAFLKESKACCSLL